MPEANARIALPLELTPSQVRPVVYRVISKKHGLNLKSSALDVLADFLGHHFGAEWRGARAEKFLDEVARAWKDEDRGPFVDGDPLKQVIGDLMTQEALEDASGGSAPERSADSNLSRKFNWRDYFKVANTHDQRRFVYNATTHHFEIPSQTTSGPQARADDQPHVIGDAKARVQLFPTRYHLLADKIFRNDLFQAPLPDANAPGQGCGITPIKNMLGRANQEFFLFGLLEKSEGDSGPVFLIDASGKIGLEFSDQTGKAPDHYYVKGGFAVCLGVYRGTYFEVSTIGPPVAERRIATSDAYGHIDFYGLVSGAKSTRIERIDHNLEQTMYQEEQAHPDNRFVFLGCDVFLDQVAVVDCLRRVFRILAEDPPAALIIPGSFLSVPFQANNSAATYREAMNALAQLLQGERGLAERTKIIMVPGDNDPWQATFSSGATPLWPLQPVPGVFASRVNRAAADVVWASNPTRLLYLTQEIVIARDNYGKRFREQSIDLSMAADISETKDPDSDLPTNDEPHPMDTDHAGSYQNGETNSEANGEANDAADGDIKGGSNLDKDEEELHRKLALMNMVETTQEQLDLTVDANAAEARKVVATLLDQSHLSPFDITARPVTWDCDQALSMAQWPTVLVLLDPTTPRFQHVYEGCAVLNPGPFLYDRMAHWLEFWPSSGRYEVRDLVI